MLAGVSGASLSQSLDNQVIASGGQFDNGAIGSVSATTGEPFINTLNSPNLMVTQGFQQPVFVVTGIITIGDAELQVWVYPNPTSDYLYIRSKEEGLKYQIVDLSGKEMATGKLSQENNAISLNQYVSSVFFVKVYSEGKNYTKTFKITKL
jgi:hypothetical protein